MDKACKFHAQFYLKGKKNILSLKKAVELEPFIIVCTLAVLSVKYEEYQYYHWSYMFKFILPLAMF